MIYVLLFGELKSRILLFNLKYVDQKQIDTGHNCIKEINHSG